MIIWRVITCILVWMYIYIYICMHSCVCACVRVCVCVFCRFAARIELVFLHSKVSIVMQYYNCILNITTSYFMFCMPKDRFWKNLVNWWVKCLMLYHQYWSYFGKEIDCTGCSYMWENGKLSMWSFCAVS